MQNFRKQINGRIRAASNRFDTASIFDCAERFFRVQTDFSLCRAIFPCAKHFFRVQSDFSVCGGKYCLCRAFFLCAKRFFALHGKISPVRSDFSLCGVFFEELRQSFIRALIQRRDFSPFRRAFRDYNRLRDTKRFFLRTLHQPIV